MIAVIPARGGSQGVARKNIVDIGGHPLIAYSIAACQMALNIDRIIISTEDEEIARVAQDYGGEVPFMRPSKFSKNDSSDFGFLHHFFENINCKQAALIRPTTPFRSPRFMDKVIVKYFSLKDSISGLRTVRETSSNPYKVYTLENNICKGFFNNYNGNKDYSNLPRQNFPRAFTGNGHIDIVKKETISKKKSVFGNRIYGEICEDMIDIDTSYDLEMAKLKIKSGHKILNFLNNPTGVKKI